ncbi:MAG: amino acid--tRNA ligase-related protein, partial [Candidatus Methanofastidiosia archaeon]
MKTLYIQDLKDRVGEKVELKVWVHRKRRHGNLIFLALRDSTGIVQASIKKDLVDGGSFSRAKSTTLESSVKVKGRILEDSRAPTGIEIQVKSLEIINLAKDFPIKKDTGKEVLLDLRHLYFRSQKITHVMKARAFIIDYLREFFEDKGFWEVSPPILTKAGCEGGTTLFDIEYFGEEVYLSQSAQLYNEVFITGLEKIYVLAPSFRAEKSRTPRHLTEYWHLEEEAAFYDNEDNIKLQEELIFHLCQRFAEHEDILKFFGRKPSELKKVKPPFPKISYTDAISKLQEKNVDIQWGDDLGDLAERKLSEEEKLPIFVCNYPKKAKPFYMKLNPKDPETVLNSDLL